MSKFAKLLLIATSLSPLLGAVAVNKLANGASSWQWFLAAVLLAFICWGVLLILGNRLQKNTFTVNEFESNDKEALAFLLTYMLPFLSTDKLAFKGDWLTGIYIIAVIFFTLVHADAFHFNPVMGFFGFHFYKVKGSDGLSHLLISKDEVRRPGQQLNTVSIAHNIHLQIKE